MFFVIFLCNKWTIPLKNITLPSNILKNIAFEYTCSLMWCIYSVWIYIVIVGVPCNKWMVLTGVIREVCYSWAVDIFRNYFCNKHNCFSSKNGERTGYIFWHLEYICAQCGWVSKNVNTKLILICQENRQNSFRNKILCTSNMRVHYVPSCKFHLEEEWEGVSLKKFLFKVRCILQTKINNLFPKFTFFNSSPDFNYALTDWECWPHEFHPTELINFAVCNNLFSFKDIAEHSVMFRLLINQKSVLLKNWWEG